MLVYALIACAISSGVELQATAETNAARYADSMGLHPKGLACSGADSDWDGYVTCTLNLGDDDLRAIECGYADNSGCKLPTPKRVLQAQP